MAVLNPDTWQFVDTDDEALRLSLESRLNTALGTYVGLEGFGTTIAGDLGEFFDETQRQTMIVEITQIVDPILAVEKVDIVETQPGKIRVNINGRFDVTIQ